LGVLPGIVGSIQALEAIKVVLDYGDVLRGRLLTFDAAEVSFREYRVRPDPTNQIMWENRDRIQVVELDGLCGPAPLEAPPAG
ncbi:MAG: molybdopterin biosynthesis protein MoeB, partial [bacterium]|nr:molybdopterin biosynthesis protein MoeB [bacterium]